MSRKSALGKGMDGLLPVGFNVSSVAEPGEKIIQLQLTSVKPNPHQPRKSFDETALEELTKSVKEHGVIQPIIVGTKDDKNEHVIIAGERRWRASKDAGLKTIPAIIRDSKSQQQLEIAIIENVQRVDLSPLEEAMSIYRLKQEFSLTPQEISKKLGKATTTISNILRLLQLPDEAKNALMNNQITEGHARAILSLTDEKQQNNLLNKIITQKLSVREAEVLSKSYKQGRPKDKKSPQPHIKLSATAKKYLNEAAKSIHSNIVFNQSKSQLIISIENEDQLKNILKKL